MPLSKDYKPDFQGRRFIGLPDNVTVRTNQHNTDVMGKELSTTLSPKFLANQRRRLEQLYLLPPAWAQEMVGETDSLATLTMGHRSSASMAGLHTHGFQESDPQCELPRSSSRSTSLSQIDWCMAPPSEQRSTPKISEPEPELSPKGRQRISRAASVSQVLAVERERRKMPRARPDGRPGLEQFYNFDMMHNRPKPGCHASSLGSTGLAGTARHSTRAADAMAARG